MKLEPLELTERLYVRVARQIAGLLERGEVKIGEKLPSERDMAEMLRVSRPTIREAMIALEVSGLIEVRTGSGIYVRDNTPSALERVGDSGIGPFDILELRLMIEPEAAALAAERMTDEQIAELEAIVAEMHSRAQSADLEAVDLRFHVHLARCIENAAILATVEWLWRLRSQSELSRSFHRTIFAEGVHPVIEEHRAIARAIAARDPEAARTAMREHLTASTQAAAAHFNSED